MRKYNFFFFFFLHIHRVNHNPAITTATLYSLVQALSLFSWDGQPMWSKGGVKPGIVNPRKERTSWRKESSVGAQSQ